MSEQSQKSKPSETKAADKGDAEAKDLSEQGEELKAEMDDLIDEIDEVLEENAQEFVANYVQRGGE